jgi:hypothetical protein
MQSSAQLYLLAETNPQLREQKQDAQSGAADATLALARRTELLDLNLSVGATVRRYSEDVGLDRDDQLLALGAKYRGERYSVLGNAAVTRDSTLTSELGTTGIDGDNRRHRARQLSLAPEWQLSERHATGLTLGWQDSTYERGVNSALADYSYTSASLSNTYATSEAGSVALLISAGRMDSALYSFDTTNIDMRLELQHAWSQRWQGAISGGASRVSAGGRRHGGSLFSGSLTRNSELLGFDLSLSRSNAPSGTGLLTRRDEAALSARLPLSEYLSVSAGVSVARSREFLSQFDLALGEVRYARADLSLSWNVARDWTLALGAGGIDQKRFDGGASGRTFDARMTLAWRTYNPLG